MVLLSITPLLDGVLRLDIIAPFHTSGPPLLQFHLAIEQWGTSVSPIIFSISFSNTMYTILQMPQSASTSAFRAEVWALERKDQDSCAFFTGSGNYSRHWIAVGF